MTRSFDAVRLGLLATVLCAMLGLAASDARMSSHCGKKFRIATHVAAPFISVESAQCSKQRCPPEAFGDDGGLTYRFLMEDILPLLKVFCENASAPDTNVAFDWYIPPTGRTLASNALKMVCNNDFADISPLQANGTGPAVCPSANSYSGASTWNDCSYQGDATCVSPGPDMVAGAVHILRERLDMLDFSMPYLTVRQVVVKRSTFRLPDFMNTFYAFEAGLWFVILAEIAIVWVCILLVETWTNDQIEKQTPLDPFYDSFYWAFGSALDPGGPGKAPVTAGGRIFMIGHWFFLVIMAASYTGSIGPFLAADDSASRLTSLDSLASGAFSVVVRGPTWNDTAADAVFLGTPLGGNAANSTARSTQFKVLQTEMRNDNSKNFKIWSTQRMETHRNGEHWVRKAGDLDACTAREQDDTIELGAFDMVACGNKEGAEYTPDALIFDQPSVYYEIGKRAELSGGLWASCDLKVVGESFSPSSFGFGFPKNSPYAMPFSKAINQLVANGRLRKYETRYKTREEDLPLACRATILDSEEIYLDMVAGLFFFTLAGIIISVVWGVPERMWFRAFHKDEEEEEEEVVGTIEDVPTDDAEKPATTVTGLCDTADRIEAELKKLLR